MHQGDNSKCKKNKTENNNKGISAKENMIIRLFE
jgi:hypothetical protein